MAGDSWVSVVGGELVARDYGGNGPDVVLIHGAGNDASIWDSFVRHLAGRVRAVSYDVRGHGQSPISENVTFEDHVTDLHAVIEQLSLRPACIVGHSLGAYIGLSFGAAVALPRGLINLDGPILSFPESYRIANLTWDLDEIRASLVDQCFVGSPEELEAEFAKAGIVGMPAEAAARRRITAGPAGSLVSRPTIEEWMGMQRAVYDYDPTPLFEQQQGPHLLVVATANGGSGDQQAFMNAKVAAAHELQQRGHAEVVTMDTGHFVQTERPEDVAGLVVDFATRVEVE